jgi:hypothetical protein
MVITYLFIYSKIIYVQCGFNQGCHFLGRYVNISPLAPIKLNPTNGGPMAIYGQSCFKRSPLGHRKSGIIRQVTS